MDMKQLEEKVKTSSSRSGGRAGQLTSDASFMEDLGADSLDTVELVMAFEKEFDIDIPDEEARSCVRWDRRCSTSTKRWEIGA